MSHTWTYYKPKPPAARLSTAEIPWFGQIIRCCQCSHTFGFKLHYATVLSMDLSSKFPIDLKVYQQTQYLEPYIKDEYMVTPNELTCEEVILRDIIQ